MLNAIAFKALGVVEALIITVNHNERQIKYWQG